MATALYHTLEPHRDASALMDRKRPDIMRKFEAATKFWTHRNVTRLTNTYEEVCNQIHAAHHESVHIMKDLFDKIETIHHEAEAHENEGKSLKVRSGVKLMSAAEITEFKTQLMTRVHTLALREFEDLSINRISNLSVSFSKSFLEQDPAFCEASSTEVQLQFGQLNFEEAHAFKVQSDNIRYIMAAGFAPKYNSFDILQESYNKQISILRKNELTVVSVYQSWIINIDILVTKLQDAIGRSVAAYEESEREHREYIEVIKEKYSHLTSPMQKGTAMIKEKYTLQATVIANQIKALSTTQAQLEAQIEKEVKALERATEKSFSDTRDLIGLKTLEVRNNPSDPDEIESQVVDTSKDHLELRKKNKAAIQDLLTGLALSKTNTAEKIQALNAQRNQLEAQAQAEIKIIEQEYAPTAAQIRAEIEQLDTTFEIIKTSKMDAVAQLNELLIKINSTMRPQLHAQAHKEYLQHIEKYSHIGRLMVADIQPLFAESRDGNTTIYNSETNAFKTINQKEVNKNQIKATLSEIHHLVYLLLNNYSDAFEKLRIASGKNTATVGELIQQLIDKMQEIENSYYKGLVKSLSNPKTTQKVERDVITHIKSHIQGVLNHFSKGSETNLSEPLESFFQEDSSSLFYLQLAEKMKLTTQTIPLKFREQLGSILSKNEVGATKYQEFTTRESSANSESEKKLALLREIFERDVRRGIRGSKSILQGSAYLGKEVGKECKIAIRHLDRLKKLPDPSKLEQIKKFTIEFHKRFPNALFHFELLNGLIDDSKYTFTFTAKSETKGGVSKKEVITFKPKLIAVVEAMVGQYLLNIRPYEASKRDLTSLEDLMAVPKDQMNQKITVVQKNQLEKLQKTFGETLIMGLRFYHTHMALLTNYLDWPREELNKMFLEHTLKMSMIEKTKTKKVPNRSQLMAYKGTISQSFLRKAIERAKLDAQTFCEYLAPFRQIQTTAYLFFSDLASLLIKDPDYLTLPDLNIEDIDLLGRHMDEIDTQNGVFNQTEESAAQAIKDHLPAIKEIIRESSSENVVKNLTKFFETPLEGSGDILAFKKVSVLNLKLVIKILKLKEVRDHIEKLNLKAMNDLFTQQETSWDKYTKQTANFITKRSSEKFDKFKKSIKLEAFNTFAYNPPTSSATLEYFKAAEPLMVHDGVVNSIFLKWPAFMDDLTKRFANDELEPLKSGIKQAATSFNEAKRIAEAFV